MSRLIAEFREFAVRGNVVDMAVGIVVGGAFTLITRSLVDDILMPPVGLLLGGADFTDLFVVLKPGAVPGPYATLDAARASGAVTMNYGLFATRLLSFVVLALAMFGLVRSINRLRRRQADPATAPVDPVTRTCPHCISEIPRAATRCPHCTSAVEPLT